jgi:mono/diheme cytochrome c family protein
MAGVGLALISIKPARFDASGLARPQHEKNWGKKRMTLRRNVATALACAPLLLAAPATAQDPGQQQTAHPGRSVVMSKCFQCHTDAMFRDQRQDRRGWEAAIHRMIGRGGLWSSDEIKLMADYLSTDFGPISKAATQSK